MYYSIVWFIYKKLKNKKELLYSQITNSFSVIKQSQRSFLYILWYAYWPYTTIFNIFYKKLIIYIVFQYLFFSINQLFFIVIFLIKSKVKSMFFSSKKIIFLKNKNFVIILLQLQRRNTRLRYAELSCSSRILRTCVELLRITKKENKYETRSQN